VGSATSLDVTGTGINLTPLPWITPQIIQLMG